MFLTPTNCIYATLLIFFLKRHFWNAFEFSTNCIKNNRCRRCERPVSFLDNVDDPRKSSHQISASISIMNWFYNWIALIRWFYIFPILHISFSFPFIPRHLLRSMRLFFLPQICYAWWACWLWPTQLASGWPVTRRSVALPNYSMRCRTPTVFWMWEPKIFSLMVLLMQYFRQ